MTTASLPARVRKCQDLTALEEEGGDAELLSLSLWSLSSEDEGTAELLQEPETEKNIKEDYSISFITLLPCFHEVLEKGAKKARTCLHSV